MKFLGIDYGTKRIGFAISPDGRVALPFKIVESRNILRKIKEIVREEKIEVIVLGIPTGLAGEKTFLAKEVQKLVKKIKKEVALPVYQEKEFFTTRMVKPKFKKEDRERFQRLYRREPRKAKSKGSVDDKSAALILQSFLDRHERQDMIK